MKISCATHIAHLNPLDAIWRTCVHSGIPFGWPWRSGCQWSPLSATASQMEFLYAHMCAKWRLMDFHELYV